MSPPARESGAGRVERCTGTTVGRMRPRRAARSRSRRHTGGPQPRLPRRLARALEYRYSLYIDM